MIVCPLSVLGVWAQTLRNWTSLKDHEILMADHQCKITEKAIRHCKIMVTTPDVLIQAFKTFMWKDPKGEQYETKNGKIRHRACFVRGIDPKNVKRKAMFGDKLPPLHPLFKHLETCKATEAPAPPGGWTDKNPVCSLPAFAGVFVDEIHTCSNPKTWSGHIVTMMCKQAVFTVGLTGTPVRAKPRQVAWLVKCLNAQPEWLQEAKYYLVNGGGDRSLRRDTTAAFHNEVVDRVDVTTVDLVPVKHVKLQFDPFIGRRMDGSHNLEQIKRHDTYLLRAQKAATDMAQEEGYRKKYDEALWQAFSTMTQMTFCPVLGTHSAEAFQKEPKFYRLAAKQPTQQQRLLWLMIRDRQKAGHTRIVVFSESSVMLMIARNAVAKWGHCGELFLYTGCLNVKQRDDTLKKFLHKDCPKGVLFMSRAGAIGTTICPGCDTLFVVGDIPWNSADLEQAHGRVHRINQDKPVEIVQFEPLRSVISAKLDAHIDKHDRLGAAMLDQDWSNFRPDADEQWRLRTDVTLNLTTLDANGNYKKTADMEQREEEWRQGCETAKAEGKPEPPLPEKCVVPPATLADDMVLPPVSWPIEGFVEPESEDEGDDDEASSVGGSSSAKSRAALPMMVDDCDENDQLLSLLDNPKVTTGTKRSNVVLMTDQEQEETTDAVTKALQMRRLMAIDLTKDDDTDSLAEFVADDKEEPETWSDDDEEEGEEETEDDDDL